MPNQPSFECAILTAVDPAQALAGGCPPELAPVSPGQAEQLAAATAAVNVGITPDAPTLPIDFTPIPTTPAISTVSFDLSVAGRQAEIARITELGASQEQIDNVRFWPNTFNPADPTECTGNLGSVAIAPTETGTNQDFSCFIERKRGGIFAVGRELDDAREEFGEDLQNQLNSAENQINRTDEQLAEYRDEAREGFSSLVGDIFGLLPGGKFFAFIGFAIIAIVVLLLIRLIVGIIRR